MTGVGKLAALFDRAVENHRAGLLDAAATLYREVLASAPDHAGALSNLGRIARSHGDLQSAIGYYRRAASNAAAPAEVHYNLGNALADAGASVNVRPMADAASLRAFARDWAAGLAHLPDRSVVAS
ncbi:MAG: tetratricopeptide repeat protein, partial [Pseudomonadota bacterium]